MTRRRIYDDELHAQFVTFSYYRWRRLLDHKYYPFNLYSERKAREKLDCMHLNPVRAGLVERACDWRWSSARHFEQGESVGVPLAWVF